MVKPSEVSNNIAEHQHELRILLALRKIIRTVDINSRQLKTKHDITSPQLITLLAIIEHGSTTIASLSEQIHLSPSTLVGIIDRLEKKELVRRERDTTDRRKVFISATSAGKKFAANAPSPLQTRLAEALDELPEKKQATISKSVEQLVEMLQAENIDASPVLEAGEIAKG